MRTVTPWVEYRVHGLGLIPPVLLEALNAGSAIANLCMVKNNRQSTHSYFSFVLTFPR